MRGDRLRLLDILDAIDVVLRDTPANREAFDANPPIRSHILLHIQIIGEAALKISEQLRFQYPEVPWKPIIRMRNIIAHIYFGIDWNEVWLVAVRDLAVLKPQIENVLKFMPDDPTS